MSDIACFHGGTGFKQTLFTSRWWQVPYFWAGIKAYDFVSGQECIKSSYYLNKERALELFPMLKRDRLKGAIVYYDGEKNILPGTVLFVKAFYFLRL